jgi:hypothetical protein
MDFSMWDHSSLESQSELEREEQIDFLVRLLHRQIGDNLFTLQGVSYIHTQLFRPTSSTSIHNKVSERYIRSLGAVSEHRLRNELEIFAITGQVSSFFVRDQQLDTVAGDELLEVIKQWNGIAKTFFSARSIDVETRAMDLLSRFDSFQRTGQFNYWTRTNLKDLRASLVREKACHDEMKRG